MRSAAANLTVRPNDGVVSEAARRRRPYWLVLPAFVLTIGILVPFVWGVWISLKTARRRGRFPISSASATTRGC